MSVRQLFPTPMIRMLAVVMVACSCSDATGPITLNDIAGRYQLTKVSVYFRSDPPFRIEEGGAGNVEVTIESTGDFNLVAAAATGLPPESGKFSISGNVFTVTTDDTGSVFLPAETGKFTYSDGVLSLILEGLQYLGEDAVLTTVTIQFTKR